jgi:hypothetical protein
VVWRELDLLVTVVPGCWDMTIEVRMSVMNSSARGA